MTALSALILSPLSKCFHISTSPFSSETMSTSAPALRDRLERLGHLDLLGALGEQERHSLALEFISHINHSFRFIRSGPYLAATQRVAAAKQPTERGLRRAQALISVGVPSGMWSSSHRPSARVTACTRGWPPRRSDVSGVEWIAIAFRRSTPGSHAVIGREREDAAAYGPAGSPVTRRSVTAKRPVGVGARAPDRHRVALDDLAALEPVGTDARPIECSARARD